MIDSGEEGGDDWTVDSGAGGDVSGVGIGVESLLGLAPLPFPAPFFRVGRAVAQALRSRMFQTFLGVVGRWCSREVVWFGGRCDRTVEKCTGALVVVMTYCPRERNQLSGDCRSRNLNVSVAEIM